MNSGRKQHLPANIIASAGVLAIDLLITASPAAMITGIACHVTELWAWPDRDVQHLRRGFFLCHWYWLIYERFIPRHRHPMSHSLVPGLIIRLAWGFWPLLLLWLSLLADAIAAHSFPLWLITVPLRCIIGAIVSDCTHYLMDGYTPDKWLFGKK